MTIVKTTFCAASAAVIALTSSITLAADGPPIETRAYHGNCVFGDNNLSLKPKAVDDSEGAISAAVVTSLISNTIGRLGKALRKAGQKNVTAVVAQTNIEIAGGTTYPCVQIIRAQFANSETKNANPKGSLKELSKDGVPDRLEKANIFLGEEIYFFLELQLRPSSNGQALAIAPTYLGYDRRLKDNKTNGFGSSSTRNLAVQLSFHPPGKAADAKESVGGGLILGNYSSGTDLVFCPYVIEPVSAPNVKDNTTSNLIACPKQRDKTIIKWPLESAWFPGYSAQTDSKAAKSTQTAGNKKTTGAADASGGAPDPEFTNPVGTRDTPLTLTATVIETRAENPSLLFIADVFDDTDDTIKAELEKKLISEKADAAALETLKAKQTLLLAYDEKQVASETAQIDYCGAATTNDAAGKKDRLTKSAALRKAQMEANTAAATINQSKPYPALQQISNAMPDCK